MRLVSVLLFLCVFEPLYSIGTPQKENLPGDETHVSLKKGGKTVGDNLLPQVKDGVLKNRLIENISKSREILQEQDKKETVKELPPVIKKKPLKTVKKRRPRVLKNKKEKELPFYDTLDGVRVFSKNIRLKKKKDRFVLPSGSIALGTVMYGNQILPTEEKKLLVRIDYAFLGPNKSIVEMSGCESWIIAKSNMHTERIEGLAKDITCRSESGMVIEEKMEAVLINKEDEYAGAKASLLMPGKASLAALTFLKGALEGFSEALSKAQLTTNITKGGFMTESQEASNVTGSETKYAMGQAMSKASAKFLDWYIDYYKNLSPHLAVAPGHKVYLAVHGSLAIPKVFFKDSLSLKKSDHVTNTFDFFEKTASLDNKEQK